MIDAETGVVVRTLMKVFRNLMNEKPPAETIEEFIPIESIRSDIQGRHLISEEVTSSIIWIDSLEFLTKITLSQNQVIEIWSYNNDSVSHKLYNKFILQYPDGSTTSGESDHLDVPARNYIYTVFTILNVGKGIGIYSFDLEVWEDIPYWFDTLQDSIRGYKYYTIFDKPAGISGNYYCEDTWHHPSDITILETSLLNAKSKLYPKDAVAALENFVHGYLTYDLSYGSRSTDLSILSTKRGDCNDFADLYIGLSRAINIPTRIVIGVAFEKSEACDSGKGSLSDVCGVFCQDVLYYWAHAWAESYYGASTHGTAFHHVDPTWGTVENPRTYYNDYPCTSHMLASAYTHCADDYQDGCGWTADSLTRSNGFLNVTTSTDGGYDSSTFCPNDQDGDGICDNVDPDKDGDGIPNSSDPSPCVYSCVYALTVYINPLGSGAVSENPNKSAYCPGEQVTLTASPNSGYTFSSWSGVDSSNGTTAYVTMNGNRTVTANFSQSCVYTLAVNISPSGSGTVSKNPNKSGYCPGEQVTLTASANSGYTFSSWSGVDSSSGTTAYVTMNGNRTVTANFSQSCVYTLAVNISPSGSGTVTRNPDKNTYCPGEQVTLTASANSGYTFSSWSGVDSSSGTTAYVTMNGNRTVTANFSQSCVYTLAVNISPSGSGTVTRNPDKNTYCPGEQVTLTASANSGYTFSSWSGVDSSSGTTAYVTMNGNRTVTANFSQSCVYTLAVNISPSGSGTVTKSPSKNTYCSGEQVTLTAIPNSGYTFSSWSGVDSSSGTTAYVTMNGNKSVTANFSTSPCVYTMTVSISPSGSGTVTWNPNKSPYCPGEQVTLTASANSGYTFSSWSGVDSASGTTASVIMNGNRNVTAYFSQSCVYTLTVNINPSGSGIVSRIIDKNTYCSGEQVTLTASPNSGYTFSSWSGVDSSSGTTAYVTMNGNRTVTANFNNSTVSALFNTFGVGDSYMPGHGWTLGFDNGSSWVQGIGFKPQVSGTVTKIEIAVFRNKGGNLLNAWLLSDSNNYPGSLIEQLSFSVPPGSNDLRLSTDSSIHPLLMAGTQYWLIVAPPDVTSELFGWYRNPPISGVLNAQGHSPTGPWNVWAGDYAPTLKITGNPQSTYTLTINVSPSGAGSVTLNPPGGIYNAGQQITLTASANLGYTFSSWSGVDSSSGTTAYVTMNGNRTVTANFSQSCVYTLAVNVNPSGSGTVTRNPDKSSYCPGEQVTLTSSANSGYTFSSWSGVDSSSGTTAYVTMDGNRTVTANFTTTRVSYTINPNASYSYVLGNNQITSWQGNLDDGYFDLALGDFHFQFYGSPVTNVRITTNGYITFETEGTFSYWDNKTTPNADVPNAMIAPFWDDLDVNGLSGDRGVWWGFSGTAPNRQLVIEWFQVPSRDTYGNETYTFEVILYESIDKIKFQYLDVDSGTGHDFGASATVGIENFDGTEGVQYSYNTSRLSNGLAIEFIPTQPTNCDFNSDGKTDILWRNKTTGQNVVWFMNGAAFSSYSWIDTVSDTNWEIVGTGDFNGDGKTDILWRNKTTGQNVVWFMNGAAFSSYSWIDTVSDTNWEIVGTGDFNGDGKTDILWRNKSTGQNIIWLMNGTTLSSYSWIDTVTDTNWQIVGTGDFNSDGKVDILWRNKSTGQNIVWLTNGTTYSGYAELMQVTDANWQIVGTGDFNSDGKTDILWRNKSTGQNVVWYMNGATLSNWSWIQLVSDTNWEIVGPK